MTSDDDRDPSLSSPDEDPTLFERRPRATQKRPGSRMPIGAVLGVVLAVLVVIALVLFFVASCGGSGSNGQTTGGGAVLLLSLLP